MPGIPSYTIEALQHVKVGADWVPATPAAGGGAGDASAANQVIGNASLASIDGKLTAPVAVSVGNWPLTQTISGNVGVVGAVEIVNDVGNPIPVSGSVGVSNFPATQPVTGTFWQATQPVSGTFWQATQPVSGSVSVGNFPATQPVSIAAMPSTPVTGTFFQGTQPVSAAALPLPAGAATETTLAATSGKLPATLGQKAMAASLAVTMATDQGAIPTTKQATGSTNVLKTGTLTTAAVTADQVVLTYTVTAGKTFYLTYLVMYGRLTAVAAAASILGPISLETPSGTKVLTLDAMNPTTSELEFNPITFSEPIPIAAGVVIRVVVTPVAATSMLWRANFGGWEK